MRPLYGLPFRQRFCAVVGDSLIANQKHPRYLQSTAIPLPLRPASIARTKREYSVCFHASDSGLIANASRCSCVC